MLRHGLAFLQEGRLTPIGHRAMPISKVRREGSAVFQVRPESGSPEKKSNNHLEDNRARYASPDMRFRCCCISYSLRNCAVQYIFKLDLNFSREKLSHEERINLNYTYKIKVIRSIKDHIDKLYCNQRFQKFWKF